MQVTTRHSSGFSCDKHSRTTLYGVTLCCSMDLLSCCIPSVCSWSVKSQIQSEGNLNLIFFSPPLLPALVSKAGRRNCNAIFDSRLRSALIYFRMTVPPNMLASFSIWTTVWISARYNFRAPFIVGAAVIAIIGKQLPQNST